MEEIKTKELIPEKELISEEDYLKKCTEYAMSTGWVKPEEKDLLINKYLKPIYKCCMEILSDIRDYEIKGNDYNKIIEKLNLCLESTRRIGSTSSENILRTIKDFDKISTNDSDEYIDGLHHAINSLYKLLNSIL